MRRLVILAALVLAILFVPEAKACQNCAQYWDWQTGTWCWFCDQNTHCGYFNCRIQVYQATGEYCTGDDGGCFTYEGAGYCGPDQQGRFLAPEGFLGERWLLVRTTVPKAAPTSARRAG